MTHPVTGVDHAFLLTDALDETAAVWRAMGFTVSPRGLHSAAEGHGEPHDRVRAGLLRAPGRDRADARQRARADASSRGRARGSTPWPAASRTRAPPAPPSRRWGSARMDTASLPGPWTCPTGGTGEAAFATLQFDEAEVPVGMMFMCEHRTRDIGLAPRADGAPQRGRGPRRRGRRPRTTPRRRRGAPPASSRSARSRRGPRGSSCAPARAPRRSPSPTPEGFRDVWPDHDHGATPRGAFAALRIRVSDPARARDALRRGGVAHRETARGVAIGPEAAGGVVVDLVG